MNEPDYKALYEQEVEAHRVNAALLNTWMKRALNAEASLNAGARAFIELHDWAKAVVGPKTR